jgi:hypothetical protein
MHNFISMYAATDDALADILAAETDTGKITSAFYSEARKRGVMAAIDPMDQEEQDAQIDDDEN